MVRSDNVRIDNWLLRIGEWMELGVEEYYFYIHQPTKGWASYTIKYLIDNLNSSYNLNIAPPTIIGRSNGQQELKFF